MRLRTLGSVVTLVGVIFVFLLMFLSKLDSFEFVESGVVLDELEHPILTSKCYLYDNVTAVNGCCRTRPYKESDVLECIRRANAKAMFSLRNISTNVTGNIARGAIAEMLTGHSDWALPEEPLPDALIGAAHWVLVGDSHLRYLFDVLVRRIKGVGLQYRMEETKTWRPAHLLLRNMRHLTIHEDIEVRHLAVPFRVTIYFDMFLTRLPTLMRSWEENKHLAPTMVILGTGLHWMSHIESLYKDLAPEAAMDVFANHIDSLRPHLTRLAATTPTVFKLLDEVQDAHKSTKGVNVYSVEGLHSFNHILRRGIEGTGVLVWDSCLPLSSAYTKHCLLSHAVTYRDSQWKCHDSRHVGYVLVEQYGNMIFNFACNKFLEPEGDFC